MPVEHLLFPVVHVSEMNGPDGKNVSVMDDFWNEILN